MDDEWMDDAWLRGHCHVHSILGPTGRAERPRPLVRVRSNVRNRREDQRDPMQASAGPLPVPSLHLQLISSCSRCRFCARYVLIISRCARCTAACSILLRSLCPQGPAGHCLLSFTNIKELFCRGCNQQHPTRTLPSQQQDRSLLPRNRYPYTTTCLGHRTGKHQAI